jgi:hypothetical protein
LVYTIEPWKSQADAGRQSYLNTKKEFVGARVAVLQRRFFENGFINLSFDLNLKHFYENTNTNTLYDLI